MIELIKTANPVRMSYLRAVLKDAGIESAGFDQGAGTLWGTAIAARLMVEEADLAQARRVIADAERDRSEA